MKKQPHIQEVKALDAFCEQCGNNHDASECGQQFESSCYVGNYNKNTMSNTYNPAWRTHPNFSWKNQNNTLNPQQPAQIGFQTQPKQNQQPLPRFIQKTDAFMDKTEMKLQNHDATLKSLETQVGSGKFLTNNQTGMVVNPSPATDTPAKAVDPAQASEDHSIPHTTTGESSAESSHAQSVNLRKLDHPHLFHKG
ncbi:hypothetical protein V6N13_034127 [Hibiscus sabdariffa]